MVLLYCESDFFMVGGGESHFWLGRPKKFPLCVARWLTSGREASRGDVVCGGDVGRMAFHGLLSTPRQHTHIDGTKIKRAFRYSIV